jgi:hypothetical protein
MKQFDYVLLAYGAAFVIFGWVTWFIVQRDRKLRRLLNQ